MKPATVLLVDDDEVLSRVLQRVLTQQGHRVVEAHSVAQAVETARTEQPQIGLVDLRLPDGDGIELAQKLDASGPRLPLILMTAYPLRLVDRPMLAERFARVLTKPLNLEELRQALDMAMRRLPKSAPASTPAEAATPTAPPPAPPEKTMSDSPTVRHSKFPWTYVGIAAVVLLAIIVLPALPWSETKKGDADSSKGNEPAARWLGNDDPDGIELPPAVVERLKLTTVPAERGAASRKLHLAGTINYDPDYLQRVHALFPGEVTELAQREEHVNGVTRMRAITFGDRVRAGELLAVVWSTSLGQLKGTLVDAIVRLRFDMDTLRRYKDLGGSIPDQVVRAQEATVALDSNSLTTAERNLSTSRVPEDQIKEVKEEAERIWEREKELAKKSGGKVEGRVMSEKEKLWPRVEVRAGIDGTIVEKNVNGKNEIILTTDFDLFRIADLEKLSIWANAYEEDLEDLTKLKKPYPWLVHLASDVKPSGEGEQSTALASPSFEKFSPVLDPYQHTALLIGRLASNGQLSVGRSVDVTISLPQVAEAVSIPVSALDEDGDSSVVFVQPDADKPRYQMRRVAIVQRLPDTVLVSSHLTESQTKAGFKEIKPGERIVSRQATVLRGALQDLKDKPK